MCETKRTTIWLTSAIHRVAKLDATRKGLRIGSYVKKLILDNTKEDVEEIIKMIEKENSNEK